MKHTKEPWRMYQQPSSVIVSDELPDLLCSTFTTCLSAEQMNANANRIVACVNACAGITNEALEAGYIKHLVEWDEVNHNCIDIVDSVETLFEFKGFPIKEDV